MGAPPQVQGVNECEALKGRPYGFRIKSIKSVAPSGLEVHSEPPTQGDALGWHNIASVGLKSPTAQLQNSRVGLVFPTPPNTELILDRSFNT